MSMNPSADGAVSATELLWSELSSALRAARELNGQSLRAVERATGWGRGSLSQIENGHSHPSRALVEWYDLTFGSDGLLVSIFAEARGAHGPSPRQVLDDGYVPGDAHEVVSHVVALGALVVPGSTVEVGWTLRNTGSVPWRSRCVQRVGPRSARDMITSFADVALADCGPGDEATVRFRVSMPSVAATLAAFWQLIDDRGQPCFPGRPLLRVVLVGHADAD